MPDCDCSSALVAYIGLAKSQAGDSLAPSSAAGITRRNMSRAYSAGLLRINFSELSAESGHLAKLVAGIAGCADDRGADGVGKRRAGRMPWILGLIVRGWLLFAVRSRYG